MYSNSAQPATRSDPPRYYISTKRGFQPYKPKPGGDAPFAVVHRGRWCLVYRAQGDAEYFADHPDAAWRMTVRWFNPNFFVFKIVTRDGGLISTGDRWDISARMDRCGGSPLECLRRTVRRLLADPNRTRRVRAA
jgi:hypothetical protein